MQSTRSAAERAELEAQREIEQAQIAIETYADAGLLPSDEAPQSWVAARYDAWIDYHDDMIVATYGDERLRLFVLTSSGVVRSEAEFDLTTFGTSMFVGAVVALFGGQS